MRTHIYIDGFNFYYGAVKGTPYKWLDFKQLFSLLLKPENQILSIKYFTALVTGKMDPDQPIRQKTFIRAEEKGSDVNLALHLLNPEAHQSIARNRG